MTLATISRIKIPSLMGGGILYSRFYLFWQIAGILAFFNKVKVLPVMHPLCLLFPISAIAYVLNGLEFYNIVKLTQLFLVFMGTAFMAQYMTRENLRKGLSSTAVLAVLMLIYEVFFAGTRWHPLYRISKHVILPRYDLIHGETNYSAVFLLSLFFISFLERKKILSRIFLILSLLSLSRGATLAYLVFIALVFIKKKYSHLIKYILYGLLFMFLLYPFVNLILYHYASDGVRTGLMKLSARHRIHAAYTEYGLKNPFGGGYLNFIRASLKDFYKGTENNKSLPKHAVVVRSNQHSLSVEVISEFGIIGYGIFCFFMFRFFNKTYNNGRDNAIALISLLTAFLFLKGFSLYPFHLFIAYNARRDLT